MKKVQGQWKSTHCLKNLKSTTCHYLPAEDTNHLPLNVQFHHGQDQKPGQKNLQPTICLEPLDQTTIFHLQIIQTKSTHRSKVKEKKNVSAPIKQTGNSQTPQD